MSAINLLTTKLAPKTAVLRIANTLKMVGMIATVVYFVSILLMVAIFIINQAQLSSIKKRQQVLTTSIESMKQTEQQHMLIKNRLSEIDKIGEKGNAMDDYEIFADMYKSMPEGSVLKDASVVVGKVETSFLFDRSSTLTTSLAKIIGYEDYAKVNMSSFSFQPEQGYLVSFEMERS